MKRIHLVKLFFIAILPVLFCFSTRVSAQNNSQPEVALLLIDIQDFYFAGGVSELVEPQAAAQKARLVLDLFRSKGLPVVHVKHKFSPGGEINEEVRPFEQEKVVTKEDVNCYLGTDLLDYLIETEVTTLVIVGMQTHMCLEAAVRASHDLGYKVIVLGDACATRDLKYDGITIKADQVHASTLSTLKSYATISNSTEFVQHFPF